MGLDWIAESRKLDTHLHPRILVGGGVSEACIFGLGKRKLGTKRRVRREGGRLGLKCHLCICICICIRDRKRKGSWRSQEPSASQVARIALPRPEDTRKKEEGRRKKYSTVQYCLHSTVSKNARLRTGWIPSHSRRCIEFKFGNLTSGFTNFILNLFAALSPPPPQPQLASFRHPLSRLVWVPGLRRVWFPFRDSVVEGPKRSTC